MGWSRECRHLSSPSGQNIKIDPMRDDEGVWLGESMKSRYHQMLGRSLTTGKKFWFVLYQVSNEILAIKVRYVIEISGYLVGKPTAVIPVHRR